MGISWLVLLAGLGAVFVGSVCVVVLLVLWLTRNRDDSVDE